MIDMTFISPAFTVDDIHKIREENYERTKAMTMKEKVIFYRGLGKEAEREIARRRNIVTSKSPATIECE